MCVIFFLICLFVGSAVSKRSTIQQINSSPSIQKWSNNTCIEQGSVKKRYFHVVGTGMIPYNEITCPYGKFSVYRIPGGCGVCCHTFKGRS